MCNPFFLATFTQISVAVANLVAISIKIAAPYSESAHQSINIFLTLSKGPYKSSKSAHQGAELPMESMQESTNCYIIPYRMGEHGLIWENMENMENTNQISLNNSIYDSKHSIHYSKHSICQPNEGENHFHLHFRKFTTFYPWSSKCIMAKYTKYTIAKMKFSIWRHGVCEICKNIDSICPFMASRVTDTIYTPS